MKMEAIHNLLDELTRHNTEFKEAVIFMKMEAIYNLLDELTEHNMEKKDYSDSYIRSNPANVSLYLETLFQEKDCLEIQINYHLKGDERCLNGALPLCKIKLTNISHSYIADSGTISIEMKEDVPQIVTLVAESILNRFFANYIKGIDEEGYSLTFKQNEESKESFNFDFQGALLPLFRVAPEK